MDKNDVEIYVKAKPFLIGILAVVFSFRYPRDETPKHIIDRTIEFMSEWEKRVRIS